MSFLRKGDGKMHKNRIYQFHKIPFIGIGLFIIYISVFEAKCKSATEYLGLFFFIAGLLFICGFSYSFDNESITRHWYFFKRSYKFSEIHLIVNFKSNLKTINIYFKLKLENTKKIMEYTRRYNDYLEGIRFSYWFQKKKVKSMINLISEANPECGFAVKDDAVREELFLATL